MATTIPNNSTSDAAQQNRATEAARSQYDSDLLGGASADTLAKDNAAYLDSFEKNHNYDNIPGVDKQRAIADITAMGAHVEDEANGKFNDGQGFDTAWNKAHQDLSDMLTAAGMPDESNGIP